MLKTRIQTVIVLILMAVLVWLTENFRLQSFLLSSFVLLTCLEWFYLNKTLGHGHNLSFMQWRHFDIWQVASFFMISFFLHGLMLLLLKPIAFNLIFQTISYITAVIWLLSAIDVVFFDGKYLKNIQTSQLKRRSYLYNYLPIMVGLSLFWLVHQLWQQSGPFNMPLLLIIAFIPWLNDTFAYFIGRAMGKRLLAPKVSPKKTVEGAIGGIVITVALYVAVMFMWQQPSTMQLFLHVIVAIILSLISILGDLFQSKLKRLVNAKDSSQLLPGHGGFFDRFDAMVGVILMNIFLIAFYY